MSASFVPNGTLAVTGSTAAAVVVEVVVEASMAGPRWRSGSAPSASGLA